MKKTPRTSAWVDLFHKGFVYTCIGVTVLGTGMLLERALHYYIKVKPQLKQQQLKEKQELLAEGSPDTLPDIASTLKI